MLMKMRKCSLGLGHLQHQPNLVYLWTPESTFRDPPKGLQVAARRARKPVSRNSRFRRRVRANFQQSLWPNLKGSSMPGRVISTAWVGRSHERVRRQMCAFPQRKHRQIKYSRKASGMIEFRKFRVITVGVAGKRLKGLVRNLFDWTNHS